MSPTSWRRRLATFGDGVRFAPPASATALTSLEGALGVALPDELRSLMAESDGVADRYGASHLSVDHEKDSRTWRAARVATFLPSILREVIDG